MDKRVTLKRAALAALAVILLPALAAAQPGAPSGPPPPPGYGQGQGGFYQPPQPVPPAFARRGVIFGIAAGIGGMSSENYEIDCIGCDYDPIAGGLHGHIGAMLSPRLALVAELQGTFQPLDADGFSWLVQTSLLGAVQYWASPRLWLKGGLGFSSLSIHYDDAFASDGDVASGGAVLAAAGYEILQVPHPAFPFAADVQFRFTAGGYQDIAGDDGFFDDTIYSGIIGIGLNWY